MRSTAEGPLSPVSRLRLRAEGLDRPGLVAIHTVFDPEGADAALALQRLERAIELVSGMKLATTLAFPRALARF